jgi:protein-S-isoprenylcysteine O-methyltransferase Ste14
MTTDCFSASGDVRLGRVSPLPYTQFGATVAFCVILGISVLLEWRVRLRSRLNRQGTRSDRGSQVVVVASLYVGLVGGLVLAGTVHRAAFVVARWPVFIVGLILMIAGIAIRQWAILVLGHFFTVEVRVHAGQSVVERGPYRWVRHPSYTGIVLTFVGVGLAVGNWAALAVLTLVPTAGLVVRIHVEESALLDSLGEPYRRFATSRSRLFPGVW